MQLTMPTIDTYLKTDNVCLHVILVNCCEVLHLCFEQLHCEEATQLDACRLTTSLRLHVLMASSWFVIFFFW